MGKADLIPSITRVIRDRVKPDGEDQTRRRDVRGGWGPSWWKR